MGSEQLWGWGALESEKAQPPGSSTALLFGPSPVPSTLSHGLLWPLPRYSQALWALVHDLAGAMVAVEVVRGIAGHAQDAVLGHHQGHVVGTEIGWDIAPAEGCRGWWVSGSHCGRSEEWELRWGEVTHLCY